MLTRDPRLALLFYDDDSDVHAITQKVQRPCCESIHSPSLRSEMGTSSPTEDSDKEGKGGAYCRGHERPQLRTTRLSYIDAAYISPIWGSHRLCMSDGVNVGLQRAGKGSGCRV